MTSNDVPDEWNFFRSRINDAPASVMTNLWYRSRAPLPELTHIAWVFLQMPDAGEHGMGTGETAKTLGDIEDALAAQLMAGCQAHYVGRVRGDGDWQLYFYLARPDGWEATVKEAMGAWPNQKHWAGTKLDADWSQYFAFICPDDERMQWIFDARVVETLLEAGDQLTIPRTVEHWAYFKTAEARAGFIEVAQTAGFELKSTDDGTEGERPFRAVVGRTDAVELDHIHAVTTQLTAWGDERDGDYDGWETEVIADGPSSPQAES